MADANWQPLADRTAMGGAVVEARCNDVIRIAEAHAGYIELLHIMTTRGHGMKVFDTPRDRLAITMLKSALCTCGISNDRSGCGNGPNDGE